MYEKNLFEEEGIPHMYGKGLFEEEEIPQSKALSRRTQGSNS